MLPSFPEDIYEAIFKDFKGDKQNLLAMTAVCRLFCILGQRYLFSNIILQAEGDIDTVPSIPPSRCIKLESILRINPDIALNVRSIKLRQSLGAFNESGTRCRLRCYSPGTEHPYLPWIIKNGPFLAHILRLLSRGRIASLSFDSTPPCSWEDLDQQLHHALLCIFRSPHFEELTITGLHNIPFTLLYQCPNTRRLELSDSTFNFSVNPQTHTLRMNCNPPRLSRLCVSLQQSNKTRILELLETGLGLDLSELDYMRLNFSNSLDLQNTKLSQLKELHIHYEGIAPSMNGKGSCFSFGVR
ncbi:hypothetical protein BDN72DRAFT_176926 [Pluteus cervinus]|uniref:Uncharacterized protein n=1 Tax=Pluteus cervinus TaxID=181527 RepID=A0ACD3AK95_9AGAR|nr:hypothetical protein BDN72DRAFT_176926 [Pluteus cervinus]